MKTTTVILSALLGFFINAASAEAPPVKGNVGAKYSSDYNRRGEILSAEALQAQVGFNVGLGSVDVFGDFFTNQSTDSGGADTDETTLGLGTSLFDNNFNAYIGIYNTDLGAAEDTLEAFASIQVETLLSPTVSVFRDTDASLYTFEGQLSHGISLEVIDLELAGVIGNTDSTTTLDRTYVGAKLTASKTVKDNLNLYADVAVSDSDDRSNETIWGLGLSVKF